MKKYATTPTIIKYYFEDNPTDIFERQELIERFTKLNNNQNNKPNQIISILSRLSKEKFIFRYKRKYLSMKTYYTYTKLKGRNGYIEVPYFKRNLYFDKD